MAGQHRYHIKHVRLVAFLVLVCLAAGLVRRVTSSSPHSSRSNWSTHRALVQPNLNPDLPITPRLGNRIQGRWEAVRASLGLPPLPHEAAELDSAADRPDVRRVSRFDLGNKRRADEPALRPQQPPLHFAADTRPSQPGGTLTPQHTDEDPHPPDSPYQQM
ncbi:hypothetical protein V8E55_011455 [Tylopilus felleus]